MRSHRFYLANGKLDRTVILQDARLLSQWNKVLRFKSGQEIVLFNGIGSEAMYQVESINAFEAKLRLVQPLQSLKPQREIYLFWSLIKRDNNEYILQKCTELGVSYFVPIVSERTIKKDMNVPRAHKIIIEASEQCGRSDIAELHEPITLSEALQIYSKNLDLFVCHTEKTSDVSIQKQAQKAGVFIGPEGGWSNDEQKLFNGHNVQLIGLGSFTLRAETAAIVAASRLLQ